MSKPKLTLLCPTQESLGLSTKLAPYFDLTIWQRPGSLKAALIKSIETSQPTLALCAMGIIARTLNEAQLPGKDTTAPLICGTEDGTTLVPVLGGHRGANDLAAQLAQILGGFAAITTASDQRFGIALDTCPPGWTLGKHSAANFSGFMQALLEVGAADFSAAPDWVRDQNPPHDKTANLKVVWNLGEREADPQTLTYIPQDRLVVGMGCERYCPPSFANELLASIEASHGIERSNLTFASINLKADEPAFIEVAPEMRFFTATQLEAVCIDPGVPNPSDIVFVEVGTHSVAEASALALAGPNASLPIPKIKNTKATLALALAAAPLDRARGMSRSHLQIIGLGPGDAALMAPQAGAALYAADTWVGYSLYLDQAEAMTGEQRPRLDYNLGDEEARCRAALDEAATGKRVALICSGDPQVYAMAQVVFELLARHPEIDGWQRSVVETLPGITAMSALAAKVGAPMGHDFCAISLSDLNTPWEVIERKVQAAAEADFVVSFYNPRSKKRDWQLPRALEILKQHRPADCPVAFGRNVSRADEAITLTTLGELNPEDIDMFTCLIIGASFTQRHRNHIFTPRGYKLS